MTRRSGLAVGLLLAVVVGMLWWSAGSDGPRGPEPMRPAPISPPSAAPATASVIPEVPRIASGAVLSLSRGELPAIALVLELDLSVATQGDIQSLPVRVIDEEGRAVDIVSRIDPDSRQRLRVELPTASLSRGRYVIEVETTEMTHLPLRRYVLEID